MGKTSEAKFKVGDRVEVRGYPAECWLGVGKVNGDDGGCVFVDFDDGRRGGFNREYVFPIASPIRTFTRREIVPGEYLDGGLEIFDDGSVIVRDWTATTLLRSAARLFNEIADVLDENSKEAA